MMADLIIAGDQDGCACIKRAPKPATIGEDIDVPEWCTQQDKAPTEAAAHNCSA